MNRPIIIAEIGCNHKGDFGIAKTMVHVAKNVCGADIVKFQKRNNRELLTEDEFNLPHPVAGNSYGRTYGEHREHLEFNVNQHRELKNYCDEIGIVYSTSVWDISSAREITNLNPAQIKIPSACNLNFPILEYLCDYFPGEIHLSLGMTSREEEEEIVVFFEGKKRNKDLVLYNCTSGYPVPFKDVCLFEIRRLQDVFGRRVKSIGFSGHHLGISVDIAAFALGVTHIERHFTLDRTWKGTDHAASLEPDGLRRLCRDVKNVATALSYKQKDILDIEEAQRKKLKRIRKQNLEEN